jgi:hypothetical protein
MTENQIINPIDVKLFHFLSPKTNQFSNPASIKVINVTNKISIKIQNINRRKQRNS